MLYSQQEQEALRRCRKNLLWSLAALAVVTTATWFFLFGAMFRGSSPGETESLLLNPFMLLSLAWCGAAVFRLARGINPRVYFWLPVMLALPLVPYLTIPFLLVKASHIIRRPPLMSGDSRI